MLRVVPDPDTPGMTAPNAAGRRYGHGTLSGYSAGRCRCRRCKDAYAVYRAQRRAGGKDAPRGRRVVNTDGHIPRRWFRDNVWLPARTAARLGTGVKVHSLRHAHASWLLAGGADLETVKERPGHASILTTQKYLHTLPEEADDAALDAFAKVRNRKRGGWAMTWPPSPGATGRETGASRSAARALTRPDGSSGASAVRAPVTSPASLAAHASRVSSAMNPANPPPSLTEPAAARPV